MAELARRSLSLRSRATLWVLIAGMAGAGSMWLFLSSQAAWRAHLDRAYITGLELFDSFESGARPPAGVRLENIGAEPPALPAGWRETRLSFGEGKPDTSSLPRLELLIHSPRIAYRVAQVERVGGASQAAGLGSVTRAIASLCGDPVLYARLGPASWRQIEAPAIWSCAAAPPDRRLWAIGLAVAAFGLLLGNVAATAQSFTTFARALREHRAGQAALPEGGPEELRQTASAVNVYVEQDRAALVNRAMLLSGVSHDLGTPATRLRLRSAQISDPELRRKFAHDIDEMTGMIDSVLTYTRAEIGTEPFRKLSLWALLEAVADDYRDVGLPVSLAPAPQLRAESGSVFAARRVSSGANPSPSLMRGQPAALRRALSNLIDNALKYGREAQLSLTVSADEACITVSDRGSFLSDDELTRLTAAFERGANAGTAPGVGLGLAIVSTIAGQHGGRLEFDRAEGGLSVRMILSRHWA